MDASSTPHRVVVVGASLAGATAALTLRERGFAGELVLVGAEPCLPYERPALSKAYLAGAQGLDDLLVHPAAAYEQAGVQLRLGRTATALDVERRSVLLDDGDRLGYDALVVATGSVNRRPPLPGLDLPGVHLLRTVDDADRLRAHAATAARVVVVGQGLVGCEVAATLRSLGKAVTAVDAAPGPLWEALGAEVSARVASWHARHGVVLVNGVGVAALEGSDAVEAVRLDDGRVLPADLVVVGVGARPATDWLAGASLRRHDGAVAVDAAGRSSAPGVHAAGDVAAVRDDGTGRHRRLEHYDAAVGQGQRVAHAVLGLALPPERPPWFWSDQYDHALQYGGEHGPSDALVWRGDRTAFWLRGGAVTAVVSLDDGRQFRRALRLLGSRQDPAALRDEAGDLRALRAAGPPSTRSA